MRHTLLLSSMLLVLGACKAPGASDSPPAEASKAETPTTIGEVELISRDALFGNPERAGVQISPDGKYVSWIAPLEGVLNVWVAPADDLSAATAVTADKGRGIRSYSWSYSPGSLMYRRDTAGDENFHVIAVDVLSKQEKDLTPYTKTLALIVGVSDKHPDSVLLSMNDRDPKWHDLYRVDLASGERTLLQKNDASIGYYLTDADFKVRFASRTRPDGGNELLKPDGEGGWDKIEDVPFDDTLTTSPAGLTHDGSTLYFLDSRNRDTAALYAVDSSTGKRTLVLEDARADIGRSLTDPTTGKVQAVAVEYLREEWKLLDDSLAADMKRLREIGPGDIDIASRTLDDKTWIVAYGSAEKPATYYRYDRTNGGNLTKLFSTRPELDDKPLVPMWPKEIKSRDGLSLVSYLTLPKPADPDADGKPNTPVPMVLLVHGGPWVRDSYGYSSGVQWLANRGYAVLQVNYRGSTGFGKSFTNAGNGEWAGKMHDDLLDAVQWAVQEGVTTPEQVAIYGGSYGGYATLVGLTFTPDTFKCGVDIVGPSNLNTLIATFPPYWASFYEQVTRRIGDPRTESGRKLLEERSPLTRVDHIARPLLIGQGANDPRVKQAESDQIVAAMQAKNIPVTYVLFPDEGHGFHRPENNKAFNAVAEGFLAGCLGGRAQPIGNDFAGSSITVPVGASGVSGLSEALKGHSPEVKK
jgi:dipeptidyl aminopeptidase/acylaminoacyl peptidase